LIQCSNAGLCFVDQLLDLLPQPNAILLIQPPSRLDKGTKHSSELKNRTSR